MSIFPSADLQESNTKKSVEKWLLEVEKVRLSAGATVTLGICGFCSYLLFVLVL